jgi:adenylate kinase
VPSRSQWSGGHNLIAECGQGCGYVFGADHCVDLVAARRLRKVAGKERDAAAVAVRDSAGDKVDAAPRGARTTAPAHRTDGDADADGTHGVPLHRSGVGGIRTCYVAPHRPAAGLRTRSDESAMRILMVAPPGAGKGTQGALIATHFNVPHIATGDLLRQHVAHQTDLGRAVQELLTRGELVPDEIVLGMVREAFIAAKEAGTGYVLDGIPRNMEQARAAYRIGLELRMTANVALHLQADDEEVTRRLLARAALEHRADDTEDVIRTRLELYHDVTHPIVAWYAERGILVSVDAMRPAEAVGREILAALEVMRSIVDAVPEQARRPIDLTGLSDAFGATSAEDDGT